MLVDAEFTIIPWDWRDFAKTCYITNDECKATLNEMTGYEDNKYDKRYDQTKKVVNFVNHEMRRPNYHQICSNALKQKKNVLPKKRRGKRK